MFMFVREKRNITKHQNTKGGRDLSRQNRIEEHSGTTDRRVKPTLGAEVSK